MAVYGRDATVQEAWQLLAAGAPVLVEGPAGIGKTVVWRTLVARARAEGWLVLACAPTEAETALPFAALADLLRPCAHLVAGLPPPQRVAAEVILLAATADEVIDERAVGAATRSLLAGAVAAASTPVLVAVDDAPWLDPPSARALRFALRRLAPRPALLVCSRTDGTAPAAVPLGLDAGPAGDEVERITLAPLGVGALHHTLRERLGRPLSRPLLARIARDAGGNPLLAIELARAVLRLPEPPRPGDDLPVAASIQPLLADVLRSLPAASRDAVRLASLLAVPMLDDLVAAGTSAAAFDPAEEAGLLTVDAAGLVFAHPAYAAAVRASIPAGIRRRLHRRLAAAVTDPDERARQLARCTATADAAVAGELAAAADRQRSRGAPAVAAGLYEQAAGLTPPGAAADGDRYRLAAAHCHFDSGDYPAADAVAATVVGGATRAEALLLRAMVAWSTDDIAGAVTLAGQGLSSVPADSRVAGRLHAHLSLFNDAPEAGRRHARTALEILSAGGDRELVCAVLLQLFFHEVRAGLPPRPELVDRALELEDGHPSRLSGTIPAIWWKAVDDHGRARARLHDMRRYAAARGDEPLLHEVLCHLGETELFAGRFAAAGEHIAAARELGDQLGSGLVGETWLAATLAAYRGDLAGARLVAEAGLRHAERLDDPWARRIHTQLRGFVALSTGRMADAAAAYGDLARMLAGEGIAEPIALRFEPDWIEACVGAGDLDEARAALDRLAGRHTRLPRPWTALGLARSRVLLAGAAGGDVAAALAELRAARDGVPADVLPLDRARCLLVAGLAHRRARRKREARDALEQAAVEFAGVGAAAFAERAQAELARVGERVASSTTLTATELRVARMAALGHTNRVIADTLFISPKTVEANLARAYRKLGVSGRAQLGAAMSRLPED
ncbi:helix-turn-helix transcriptional regulator [Polymorphospora rubra]|uniref:Transcriptional regulator n=1 Tax=Polymorphospora rubra TaxID=338584 RepID=A0A810MUT7_9ACTN|nr:LuxR family transcriptional regulator [Polymorphospora rubra]BCJ64762.1 transcriptional regulator [Polymorphospora rubra]